MIRFPKGPAGTVLLLLLVAAAGLAAFAPGLGNGFVWDDIIFIQNNRVLDDLRNIPLIFASSDAVGQQTANPYYRPLTTLTFALDQALWKGGPGGFHATNLFLHLIASGLLLLIGLRLTGNRWAALGGALLFAVHPVHAQPVAYVSARADLLCGALTAGSFLAYLTAWGERGLRRSPLVLSVLLFVLALLSKEVGFVLPVLIGVHLWQRGEVRGRALAALLPYAAVAGGALALRVLVLERQTWAPADLVTRLATTGFTMGENLKHVLLPWTLKVFNHADPRSSLSDPAVIGGWAAFLLLLALAVAAVRRAKVPALGGLWFFAALLPVSGLVAIVHPSMVADRFLYLPMLGLGVAAAGSLEGVARSWRRLPLRGAVAAAIAAASVGCAFASADRVANWRDSVSLWTRATTDQSGSGYAFTNLGSALAEEGRLGEAEAAYRSALCLGGDRGLIYCNLGWISLDRGNITGASDYARLSLEASPRNVGATLLLAECHRMRGEPGRAVALLQEARRLNPYDGRLREILRGLPAEAL